MDGSRAAFWTAGSPAQVDEQGGFPAWPERCTADRGRRGSVRPRGQFALVGLLLLAVGAGCIGAVEDERPVLILATTTSMRDSGLLDVLLPTWEAASGWRVDVVAVGSGAALEHGRRGDAHLLIVHAPEAEHAFLVAGDATSRTTFAWNRFLIVGPADDPAGLAEADSAADALLRFVDHADDSPTVIFTSRGDLSGTHLKEGQLWATAESLAAEQSRISPGLVDRDGGWYPGGGWYEAIGQGMGATLTMADERQTYTLCDRGTWLFRAAELDLVAHEFEDATLVNPYSVLTLPTERIGEERAGMAADLAAFLASEAAAAAIDGHVVDGQALFFSGAPPA